MPGFEPDVAVPERRHSIGVRDDEDFVRDDTPTTTEFEIGSMSQEQEQDDGITLEDLSQAFGS